MALNALLGHPAAARRRTTSGWTSGEASGDSRPGPGPLRNAGWILVTFFNGTLWTNQVLLNIVIPLWLVEATDAPHVLLAWLFGTNTVLCIFLPAYTSQGGAQPAATRCATCGSRRRSSWGPA